MEIHFANPRCKELHANVHAVDRAENPDLRLLGVQWFCSDRVNQLGSVTWTADILNASEEISRTKWMKTTTCRHR